jgi:hypothetical protein
VFDLSLTWFDQHVVTSYWALRVLLGILVVAAVIYTVTGGVFDLV